MIRLCMITHDQIERNNPRADLIRFRSLGETLATHSIDVVFVTLNDKAKYEKSYYKGSEVYKVPLLSRIRLIHLFCFCILILPVMFQIGRSRCFDIMVVNSILSIPGVLIFKWLSRRGIIQFDLMGILSEEKFIRRPKKYLFKTAKKALFSLENFLWSHVDFITTINDQHKHLLLERIKKPVYVVRDGVFEALWKNPPRVEKDPVQDSNIILIFVGQINHFRLDPLFKILPNLIAEIPKLQLQILGAGRQLRRYSEMVLNLGLEEHVAFLGHVPHERIFDYIAGADIGYSDDWSINGFPMKLFDYMALGKAIVAEGTESIKELLTDQVNALLYTNEAELKEKILKLAKDTSLREKIGNEAHGMMDQHTWEKRIETLWLIYQPFINRNRKS